MIDYLYTGHLKEPEVAFSFAVTTALANVAVLKHNCGPVSGHILGRALTAGLLSASMLGDKERINIRWQYNGHLKTLIVDASSEGDVRGFISPKDLMSYEGESHDIFGEGGRITVVRTHEGQVRNDGVAETRFHNAIQDLAFFFSTSDQLETGMCVMIGLAPDVDQPVRLCQGLMIQALPGCDLERFNALRTNIDTEKVHDLMTQPSDADSHFETVLNAMTEGVTTTPGITIGRLLEPRFRCTCSKEKMQVVARTLAAPERKKVIEKNEALDVLCQFCSERYVLSVEDCRQAWQDA